MHGFAQEDIIKQYKRKILLFPVVLTADFVKKNIKYVQ